MLQKRKFDFLEKLGHVRNQLNKHRNVPRVEKEYLDPRVFDLGENVRDDRCEKNSLLPDRKAGLIEEMLFVIFASLKIERRQM